MQESNEKKLNNLLSKIGPSDEGAREKAHCHWAELAKPLGSLGVLEEDLEQISSLLGTDDFLLSPRKIFVLCADNGVVAQGVTQTGSEVTAIVTEELAQRRTSVCQMAEVAGADLCPVDMGVKDYPGNPGVLDRRVGNGTGEISVGPAMEREQAASAILTGMALVEDAQNKGYRLLGTGEMGIGNTTTSSAVTSVLLGRNPADMTGKGAGLSDEGLARKIQVIERAIAVNKPDPSDPLDVLAKLGGFDIAGMCGIFLGGAYYGVPVLMDGFISNVAALCAVRICPNAEKAVLASHTSTEPAVQAVMEAIGRKPLISAGMRLGEGTGAAAAMPLLDMALAVFRSAYTFEEGGIEPYKPC